ncbi:MAG: hypothetical protein AAF711_09380 [Planctomycetota bacterium]
MAEIDPKQRAYIHRKVDEVISGNRPRGVDYEWIERTSMSDRAYALELLRWHAYGKERCQAGFKYVIEHIKRA